jgi:hypothetical protein
MDYVLARCEDSSFAAAQASEPDRVLMAHVVEMHNQHSIREQMALDTLKTCYLVVRFDKVLKTMTWNDR